ncbi:MAG: hypothetical protein DMG80_07765 [Acidobacteria bacterium]|nr:MAG: hypothetical protein DMG80_07765 [Acidobacteriota bacterium]
MFNCNRLGQKIRIKQLVIALLILYYLTPACYSQFLVAPQYAGGGSSQVVAVGDFNNDHHLDVVTANAGGGNLGVWLGNGDGTFQTSHQYNSAEDPLWVVVADFNRDGKLDLAASNYTDLNGGTVSILLGNGDGTFQPHVDYLVGPWSVSLAVGDFNGDQIPDLAAAVSGTNSVALLIGNGDGTFQGHRDLTVGNFPSMIAVADFNIDGHMDLAVTNLNDSTISILLGNGDGTFQASANIPVRAYGLLSDDMNDDGRFDLVIWDCCSVTVLLSKGNGAFDSRVAAAGELSGATTIGDFNGDGKKDVANAFVVLFLGKGDGTLNLAPERWGTQTGTNWATSGDFNEDGRLDLVTADEGGSISVLIGNGNGSFQADVTYGTLPGPTAVASTDFNGDGFSDVAVGTGSGLEVFLGNGDSTLTFKKNNAVGDYPVAVITADFNQDGKADLVTANVNNSVSLLLGVGDGTFGTHADFATGSDPVSVAAGDLNGDGKLDLITANAKDNSISILLGDGHGSFQSKKDLTLGTSPLSLAVGDFNGDKKVDLAAVHSGDAVSVLLGNGDGTFQPAADYPTGLDPRFVAVGDFDHNGFDDLAVAFEGNPNPLSYIAPGVSIFINRGSGSFLAHSDVSAGGVPLALAVSDFDGDGNSDLAAADGGKYCRILPFEGVKCYWDTSFGVLLGRGNGTFKVLSYFTGLKANSVYVSDLNRDGRPDVVLSAAESSSVNLFLNNSKGFRELLLSVSLAGGGGGVVTSSPVGINCGSTGQIACTANFVSGLSITLTAVAAPGSVFTGWAEDCSGTSTCTLTMNSDHNVSAAFQPMPDFSFTVSMPTPAAVAAGQSATSTITVDSLSGFNDMVSFTCSVSPAVMLPPTCSGISLTPPAGNSVTGTLTIQTSAPALSQSLGWQTGAFFALWLPMAGMMLAFAPTPSKYGRYQQRLFVGLSMLLVLAVLLLLPACGGDNSKQHGGLGTPSGNYTITINATAPGGLRHSTTLMLKVQ